MIYCRVDTGQKRSEKIMFFCKKSEKVRKSQKKSENDPIWSVKSQKMIFSSLKLISFLLQKRVSFGQYGCMHAI